MAVRLTRVERKERTRSDLLEAARRVFLRRGFHGASLDEIAETAGYTKGAVYSNFSDKDALFLAVLEEHYAGRVEAYTAIMLDGDSLDETFRAISTFMAEADQREPHWLPLLAEFTAHAARREELRRSYVEVRRHFLEAIANLIAMVASRHGATLRVTPLEAARASSILARGFSADRTLDPAALPPSMFVELNTALMHGLTVRDEGTRR
jgi:AcrR family transcriptional regulator